MLQNSENRPTVADSAPFTFSFTVFGAKLTDMSPPLGWNQEKTSPGVSVQEWHTWTCPKWTTTARFIPLSPKC